MSSSLLEKEAAILQSSLSAYTSHLRIKATFPQDICSLIALYCATPRELSWNAERSTFAEFPSPSTVVLRGRQDNVDDHGAMTGDNARTACALSEYVFTPGSTYTVEVRTLFFWRFPRWHITSRGAAFLRVFGQPHERMCSLPVSVPFRVGSAEKNNQEFRDGNRTLFV